MDGQPRVRHEKNSLSIQDKWTLPEQKTVNITKDRQIIKAINVGILGILTVETV